MPFEGTHIVVFYDRVKSKPGSAPSVLGHVIAHEVAHILQGVKQHSESGIMKAQWTGADYQRMAWKLNAQADVRDEAGEMSPPTQAKLLRVLADGKILRVGSTKPRDVDVRVLTATHRDLEERVRQGVFRQDLYYRLAVVPIALAPLRKRREDIPGLCESFCRQVSRELKMPMRPISAAALEKLKSCLSHLLKRCREMAQIASPAAAAFPLAVRDLLQTSLALRDRYAQGEISERGMRSAGGRLEAQLDQMLETRYRNPIAFKPVRASTDSARH